MANPRGYPVPTNVYNGPCPQCGAPSNIWFEILDGYLDNTENVVVRRYHCKNPGCNWMGPHDVGATNQNLGPAIVGNPHAVRHAIGGNDFLDPVDLGAASKHPDFIEVNFNGAASITWANMPITKSEFAGDQRSRTKVDLTDGTTFRLVAAVLSNITIFTAKLGIDMSVDQTSWSRLDDGDTLDPECHVDISDPGLQVTNWFHLKTAAKADVFLRLYGVGGDAIEDPIFGKISLQVG